MRRGIWIICLAAGLLSSCSSMNSGHYNAIEQYNLNVAKHEAVSLELDAESRVKKISFRGFPRFMQPKNQALEWFKTAIPLARMLMDGGGGAIMPTLEAGGDITYHNDSGNIDTDENRIVTSGGGGGIYGPVRTDTQTISPTITDDHSTRGVPDGD